MYEGKLLKKMRTFLFIFCSIVMVLPVCLLFKDFVTLWSLMIIPVIGLLHIFPQWKTGVYSTLSLIVLEVFSVNFLYDGSITNYLTRELYSNCLTNSILISILTTFFIKGSHLQIVDPLTKALNRNFYNTFAENKKNLTNLSLQLIDIDHFKKINDTFGHPCGDYVLSELVKVITKEIRKTDKIVRLGGEEFIILSPNTTSEEGYKMAKRIRKLIEHTEFIYEGEPVPVTVSIGFANQQEHLDSDVKNLLNRADKALYVAKQNGRNQVTL